MRRGLSENALAHAAGVDPSYVNRLAYGKRDPPRREVVAALARALALSAVDEGQLFTAAGYAPTVIVALGWDEVWQAVADVRADWRLTAAEHAEFAAVISAIARRYSVTAGAEGSGDDD